MRPFRRVTTGRCRASSATQRVSIASSTPNSLHSIVMRPNVPVQSLLFIPPPRWAAELMRRMDHKFPELKPAQTGNAVSHRHCARYLQAFVHPSFTAPEAAHSTMQPLVSLGEALLVQSVTSWIEFALQDLTHDEWHTLLATLTSDSTLKRVLAEEWGMADLVLSEASSSLLTRQKSRSTRGLTAWLATGGHELPEPHGASCVKAVIASVYLEKGLATSTQFCTTHVLPHIAV